VVKYIIAIILFFLVLNTIGAQESYQLVWSDEFDGISVDTNNWFYETGAHGWGNNELQNYTDGANTEVKNGILKISAKLEGSGQEKGDYTSARMVSKKSFTYGKIEIHAKLPTHKGDGLWPALWMLGENIKKIGWPNCGEIDIMEYVSYAPDTVYFTIHSSANNHRDGTQISSGHVFAPSIEEEFHKYGFLWTERSLDFYLDEETNIKLHFDRPVDYTNDNWPFDKPFNFLLNIAVGGDWGGKHGVDDSIFPAVMEVDYIRVYQKQ
jgi:beta-glucanase (GH16 family)